MCLISSDAIAKVFVYLKTCYAMFTKRLLYEYRINVMIYSIILAEVITI